MKQIDIVRLIMSATSPDTEDYKPFEWDIESFNNNFYIIINPKGAQYLIPRVTQFEQESFTDASLVTAFAKLIYEWELKLA